ncbi:MAG TPA: hypothetical protein ENI56_02390 [Candidatus Kaiserbacteria bacterium]|nr:hypothetical protein [Candidatus Kaiserbacteria bacterium]
MTYEPPNEFSEALTEVRRKYLGAFNTGIPCVCEKGNIIDHATAQSFTEIPFFPLAPDLSYQEHLDRFSVDHDYWCEVCGAFYVRSVVEKKYCTLEMREPIPRSYEVMQTPSWVKGIDGRQQEAEKKREV